LLAVDHGVLPGFELGATTHVASKVFERSTDGARLTVIMANRQALETQTGADLIYYAEQFKAFTFVQYKVMREEGGVAIFRWRQARTDDESIGPELGLSPVSYREGVVRATYSKRGARLLEKLLFLGGGSSGENTISMWKAAEAGNDRVMPARRLNKGRLVGVFR
jgi:hypothetical protein